MGCGNSSQATDGDVWLSDSPEELRDSHEDMAAMVERPPYLKAASDPLGLSNEQFELATRVFIHFDEDCNNSLNRGELQRLRDELLLRAWLQMRDKLKAYTDSKSDAELDKVMNDPDWATTIALCKASFNKTRQQKEEGADNDNDGELTRDEWYRAYEDDLRRKDGVAFVSRDLVTLETVWCATRGIKKPNISDSLKADLKESKLRKP